jgi:serine/threonine-protein kinase
VPQQSSVPQRQKPRRQRHLWQPILFLVLLIGTCASIWLVWWLATQWNPEVGFFPDSDSPETPVDSDTVAIAAENDDAADEPEPSPFSPEEQARKNRLSRRRSELGLSRPFYIGLVDQQFYAEYPEQRGKTLSDQPEDADWRRRWDDTAAEMLDLVDEHLSSSAREGLGTYGNADRDRWRDAARAIYVSDRALYDLADAQFVHIFAEQPPDEALDQPLGQIWHGLALDRLASLESGERLQTLDFEDDSEQDIKNRLEPGEGQVYIMDLSDDQEMKVRLDAPDDAALLSIYPPVLDSAEPLLDDSSKREWSGDLSQNGYYEIVVVSQTDEEFEYELKIEVND